MAEIPKENAEVERENESVLYCPCCSASFTQELTLFMHIKVSHDGKPYICGVCNRGYATTRSLKYHLELHEKMYHFKCLECAKGFRRQDYLQLHIKRFHLGPAGRDFECHLCLRKFVARKELRTHLQSHNVQQQLKCKFCTKTYAAQSYLTAHMVNVHDLEPEKKICCRKCDKKFIMQSTYSIHIRSESHNRDKPYRCDQCEMRFKRVDGLNSHKHKNHGIGIDVGAEKAHLCPVCQTCYFADEWSLQQHITEVHDKRTPDKLRCRRSKRLRSVMRRLLVQESSSSTGHSETEAQPSPSLSMAPLMEASDLDAVIDVLNIAENSGELFTITMHATPLEQIKEERSKEMNKNLEVATPAPLILAVNDEQLIMWVADAEETVTSKITTPCTYAAQSDLSERGAGIDLNAEVTADTTSYVQGATLVGLIRETITSNNSHSLNLIKEAIDSMNSQNLVMPEEPERITMNQSLLTEEIFEIEHDNVDAVAAALENDAEKFPTERTVDLSGSSHQHSEFVFHGVPYSFLEQAKRNVNFDHDYFLQSNPMTVDNALQQNASVTPPYDGSTTGSNSGPVGQAILLMENKAVASDVGSPSIQQEFVHSPVVNRNGKDVGLLRSPQRNSAWRPSKLGQAAIITEKVSKIALEKAESEVADGEMGSQVTSFEEYVLELAGLAREHVPPEYLMLMKYNFKFVLQDDVQPEHIYYVANVTVMYENETGQRVVGTVQSIPLASSK